jgi:hypothetical protein
LLLLSLEEAREKEYRIVFRLCLFGSKFGTLATEEESLFVFTTATLLSACCGGRLGRLGAAKRNRCEGFVKAEDEAIVGIIVEA